MAKIQKQREGHYQYIFSSSCDDFIPKLCYHDLCEVSPFTNSTLCCGWFHDMLAALKFWCLIIRGAKIPLFVFTAVGNSADLRDLRVMVMAVVVREVHELQKVL